MHCTVMAKQSTSIEGMINAQHIPEHLHATKTCKCGVASMINSILAACGTLISLGFRCAPVSVNFYNGIVLSLLS